MSSGDPSIIIWYEFHRQGMVTLASCWANLALYPFLGPIFTSLTDHVLHMSQICLQVCSSLLKLAFFFCLLNALFSKFFPFCHFLMTSGVFLQMIAVSTMESGIKLIGNHCIRDGL